jgi:propanediol utilization protein
MISTLKTVRSEYRAKVVAHATAKLGELNKAPAQPAAPEYQAGQAVTYVNAKGQEKQATVVGPLDTVDAQGDPQIQLKAGNATFAVDRANIKGPAAAAAPVTGTPGVQGAVAGAPAPAAPVAAVAESRVITKMSRDFARFLDRLG